MVQNASETTNKANAGDAINYFLEVARMNNIDVNKHIKDRTLQLDTLWSEIKEKHAVPHELITELDNYLATI